MRKLTTFLLISLFGIFVLASCSNSKERSGYCVTFHLEGATYQQASEIRYYYPENEEGSTLIFEPNDLITTETDKISKDGYYLEGWYLSTNFKENEKWDFSTDKLTAEGLDLYANWKVEAVYKFSIVSTIDGTVLGEYEVEEGETFSDYRDYTAEVEGYTFVEFKDEDGNIIEEDEFAHPGGDADTTINIYATFIEGDYAIIRDYDDLDSAIRRGYNLYLYNDIDCEGETLSFDNFDGRILEGNGHTISNFDYDIALKQGVFNITLFDSISNSTIKDVSFISNHTEIRDNQRTTEINILPFAVDVSNSTITNVTLEYSYELIRVDENKVNKYDVAYLNKDDNSVIDVVINEITN